MANDVGADGESVVTKKSGGKLITGPDVCKTPTPGGPVPIPYPNFSQSSDLSKGSKSVKINGVPACLKGSNFSKSTGDEPGTAKGIASSTTGGKAEPINYSFDVKIEGKSVVRNFDLFVSNNKNTPPAPVMQAPVTPSLPTGDKEKLYSCEWIACEKKHTTNINDDYPRDGNIKRGKVKNGRDYESDWVSNGLEPWREDGAEKYDPKTTWEDYQEDLQSNGEIKPRNKAAIDANMTLISAGQYKTQKHHLISVHLFDNLNSLAHNCKLIGYNVNDSENGICLPYFVPDIVRHDRQCHRGPHPPIYDDNALEMLRKLQSDAEKYCTDEQQKKLINKLDKISKRIRKHILVWDDGWELRAKAIAERRWSYIKIGEKAPN